MEKQTYRVRQSMCPSVGPISKPALPRTFSVAAVVFYNKLLKANKFGELRKQKKKEKKQGGKKKKKHTINVQKALKKSIRLKGHNIISYTGSTSTAHTVHGTCKLMNQLINANQTQSITQMVTGSTRNTDTVHQPSSSNY